MLDYIIDRLEEPSTWRGIVMFACGVSGISISMECATIIISFGVAASGLIGAVVPDKVKKY
jgi:hypothetical protein